MRTWGFIGLLVCVVAVLVPAQAFSQNTVMSRMRLLSEEFKDLKSSLINPDDVVGYAGGFFIKSRDGNYLLTINGRIQVNYAFNIAEAIHDKHSFILRRAFLMLAGHMITPKLTYGFTLSPQSLTTMGAMAVRYSFGKALDLELAYDNPAYGENFKLSSARLHFISKSIADLRYFLSASLGMNLSGEIGRLSYNVGVWNGYGTKLGSNVNQEMMYHLRLKYNLLHPYEWSGGDLAYTEKAGMSIAMAGALFHLEADPQALVMQATTSVDFKYRGLHVNAGVFFRFTDPDQFTFAQNDAAFVVEAGYFIVKKKLELAARVSALFDDLNSAGVNINMGSGNPSGLGIEGDMRHSGADVGGDSDNEWEYVLGLNYYWNGSYNSKLQLQYTYMIDGEPGNGDLTNHIGQVLVQVAF